MRLLAVALAATMFGISCDRSPESFSLPGRPSAVAVAGDDVWVTDDGRHIDCVLNEDDVEQCDVAVGDAVEIDRNPIAMAAAGGVLWIAHAGGTMTAVDTRNGRHAPPVKVGGSLTGVAASSDRAWFTDISADALIEVDDGKVRRIYKIPHGVVRVAIAGAFLWVTGRENTVTRVDPRSHEVGPTVEVGSGPIGLAYDGERIWVANSDDGTLSRIDAKTGRRVGPAVSVGNGPVALAAADDAVWVANQDDRTLVRVDQEGNAGEPIDLGFNPRGVAAGEGAVWVVGTNPSRALRVAP